MDSVTIQVDEVDPDRHVAQQQQQQQQLNYQLMTAVIKNNCENVVYLLASGASADVTSRVTRWSALHVASYHGHYEALRALRDNGAVLLRVDNHGLSPLHLAVLAGRDECAALLAQDEQLLALRVGESEVIPDGKWMVDGHDEFQELEQTEVVRNGYQALHIAVVTGAVDIAQNLLEIGADVTAMTEQGKTCFHLAVKENKMEVLRMLANRTDKNKVINLADNHCTTPLFQAIYQGNVTALKILLSAGADIMERDIKHRTVIHCAVELREKDHILKALFNYNAKTNHSLSTNKDKFYKFRRFKGTALHMAAFKGEYQSTRILLEYGCSPLLTVTNSKSYEGFTPLHIAASEGFDGVVQLLVDHNKELIYMPAADGSDRTPLHVACENRHRKTVRVLLEAGSDLSAMCTDGNVSNERKNSAMEMLMYQVPMAVDLIKGVLDSAIVMNPDHIMIDYTILMPRGYQKYKMKVLDALLVTGDHLDQQKLFAHPVIESFLRLQWGTLRIFYYLLLATNLIFVVLFSITAYLLSSDEERSEWIYWRITSGILLAILAIILTFRDVRIFQIRMTLKQFLYRESWKTFGYFLCFLVVLWPRCPKEVVAMSVILTWYQFVMFCAHDPVYGRHMFLFLECARRFSKVMISFGPLITGFVFVFLIEFQGVAPFSTLEAFAKTIVMMTNEFEYNEISKIFISHNKSMITLVFAQLVFIFFVFLIGIVLMNLLVAKAVKEISNIDFIRKLALFVSEYDRVLSGYLFKILPLKVQKLLTGKKVKRGARMSISKTYSNQRTKLFPAELRRDILDIAHRNIEDEKRAIESKQEKEMEEEKKRREEKERLAGVEMMEIRIMERVNELFRRL